MVRILIVEDENIIALQIQQTLAQFGHTIVDRVASTAAALDSARHHHPELVLMDTDLATEDGIAAGREIYEQLNIPVVYLATAADESTVTRSIRAQAFGYLLKPICPDSLHSAILVARQRHQVEVSQQRDRVNLVNIFNSIGMGVIVTDEAGAVTAINPVASSLTGWEQTEAIGQTIDRVYPLIWETDGAAIENPSLRALRLRDCVRSNDRCWLVAKDGSELPISDTATLLENAAGDILGSVLVFQDNSENQSDQVQLQERNRDLEGYQLQLISLFQQEVARSQQAIACNRVLGQILKHLPLVTSEYDLLQIALQELGLAVDADYGWVALHASHTNTANIIADYMETGKTFLVRAIGQHIDRMLYPQFYQHLERQESWIDPPRAIIPDLYAELSTQSTQILICPLALESGNSHLHPRTIGEVGILTRGNAPWQPAQAQLITQLFSYAFQIFRQQHLQSIVDSGQFSVRWDE
jgi:PAS domain S-box-containing protein